MLWMFAVAKEHRNKGIGKMLLTEFEKKCIEKKATWIMIYASNDENTIRFYKNNNYILGKKCIEGRKDF